MQAPAKKGEPGGAQDIRGEKEIFLDNVSAICSNFARKDAFLMANSLSLTLTKQWILGNQTWPQLLLENTGYSTRSSISVLWSVRLEEELHRLVACVDRDWSTLRCKPEKKLLYFSQHFLGILTFACILSLFSPWSPSIYPPMPSWTDRKRPSSYHKAPISCRWPSNLRWLHIYFPRWCWIWRCLLLLPAPSFSSSPWQHR